MNSGRIDIHKVPDSDDPVVYWMDCRIRDMNKAGFSKDVHPAVCMREYQATIDKLKQLERIKNNAAENFDEMKLAGGFDEDDTVEGFTEHLTQSIEAWSALAAMWYSLGLLLTERENRKNSPSEGGK